MVAPSKDPINAWEELLGIPRHQTIRFQQIAPTRAAKMTYCSSCTETKLLDMVPATRSLTKAPTKFMTAAIKMAVPGVNALVYTEVAIAFAVSLKPLINSKINAKTMTNINIILNMFHNRSLNTGMIKRKIQ